METLKVLDNEQERLKAELKTKTTEMDSTIETLKELLAESRKVVKVSDDQAGWREFEIEDTK